ncbi:MAG: DUF1553 domain-containing protein [Planctomycetota bacterium]
MILRFCFAATIVTFAAVLPAADLRFDRDIRPILSDKCFFCHGPDNENREADLRLDIEELAKADSIVPGDADASELVRRILSKDPDEIMPPPGAHKELSADEIQRLTQWIDEGADWSEHWAFGKPEPFPMDDPTDPWVGNPIDAYVLAELKSNGKRGLPQASREKLIRRLSFDLTGLPPTIEEVDAFLADDSDEAYEKLVDRLLGSSHYGERMAVMWMDAARYGDTSVYHADGPRDMWAWRDAIVNAYNDNMPFDQFSILQLAGDLIPDAPLEQRILAGFNRNNGTTDEGGAIAEEYRIEYAVDRVKTTSTVWMGLTMECAQCHDHKYDPITQEEYYKFFAFFNVSSDGGMQTRKGNAAPTMEIPDPEKQQQLPATLKRLAAAREQLKQHRRNCEFEFEQWFAGARFAEPDAAPSDPFIQFQLEENKARGLVGQVDKQRKGKVHGKNQWVKTPRGHGLRFDGGNYADLGDLANFERDQAFSYGGWVKPNKNAHGALLARMDDANAFRGFDVLCGDSRVEVHLIHAWPENAVKVKTNQGLKPEQWQHLFVTYDGTSKASGLKIYLDGKELEWSIERDGLSETIKTERSLLIGSRHPGSRFKGEIDEVSVFDRRLTDAEVAALAGASAIGPLLAIEPETLSDDQLATLRTHYLENKDRDYPKLKQAVDRLVAEETELKKPLTTVMVMGNQEKPRDTFILDRGAYDSPTDRKVEPGTLSVLPPMKEDLPRNRLGMAKWLFQDDHPLTARVAVNRYWQLFFGTGLVATPQDFGAQGEFPSHPELLDWLAVDFRENGWNVKRLIKQIVMSSTYRQRSAAERTAFEEDPSNRSLARGPRFRLQGEFIRDNALFVSGLLVDRLGGPGVKPYQPPGLWKEVSLGGNPRFVQDKGDKLYRRSLYTYWKRSAPPPSMQIFDAPTREKCTVARARTNTPLQALVTLNDVQFVEASRHFARRLLAIAASDRSRLESGFRMVTARRPSDIEVDVLQEILQTALTRYGADVDAAEKLLDVGDSPRDNSLDPSTHAAWTILASSLLNLDETLTRE